MKLKLSQNRDISIIDVLNDVNVSEMPALRAGIVRLFHSGKNKIILNLVATTQLPIEALKEVIKLHLIATELMGSIAIVGRGEAIKQAVESFSVPPPIKYFTTVEAAIGSFSSEVRRSGVQPPPGAGQTLTPLDELKKIIAKLEAEKHVLEGRLQNLNAKDLNRIKSENSDLKKKVTILQEQLRQLVKERKKAFDEEGMRMRIEQLEEALSQTLQPTKPAPK